MRPEHKRRLAAVQDKLVEVLLDELDPDEWPGAGLKPSQMDKDTRGDRYWCKKNAGATFALVNLNERMLDGDIRGSGELDEQERLVTRAEKQAEELVKKVMERQAAKQ